MLCDRLIEIVSQIIFMHIIVILMHKFCLQQYNRNHGTRDPVQRHNYLFIYFFCITLFASEMVTSKSRQTVDCIHRIENEKLKRIFCWVADMSSTCFRLFCDSLFVQGVHLEFGSNQIFFLWATLSPSHHHWSFTNCLLPRHHPLFLHTWYLS